jgi:hypothetical protein
MKGPTALANAPSDLKIPKTVPFWSKFPYFDVSVVMHVTTNAVAKNHQNLIKLNFKINPKDSQMAYRIMPRYSQKTF